jgi:hypothetical protein
VHQDADVVVADDDVGVRQHLQHLAADRRYGVDDLARRVDRRPVADDALGEGRVRNLLQGNGASGDRGENRRGAATVHGRG